MTVLEVLEQAKALKLSERKELMKLLVDTLDVEPAVTPAAEEEHWGKSLNRLLDTLDTSDWENLAIDDPVAWVAEIRKQEAARLDDYWNGTQ